MVRERVGKRFAPVLDKRLLSNNKNALFAAWTGIGLLFVSFAIQLNHLDARTFFGDEFGSFDEALALGKNANSLPYFILLRAFLIWSDGEFWTRFISAACAVLAAAVTYRWVPRISTLPHAQVTMLLLATSPFLLVYAQQMRFYTLALLAASLSIWAFAEWTKQPQPKRLTVWLAAAVFAAEGFDSAELDETLLLPLLKINTGTAISRPSTIVAAKLAPA